MEGPGSAYSHLTWKSHGLYLRGARDTGRYATTVLQACMLCYHGNWPGQIDWTGALVHAM